MNKDLFKNELLTQKEVAEYFRVVPGTVKNWRDQRLLSFWQAPGSTRVLYYSDEIRDFRDKNTISKKGGGIENISAKIKREKPDISSTPDKKWRI
ncbi:DNA-binding protein [bacterium]|nr:DNA-binding protein [bacterium]